MSTILIVEDNQLNLEILVRRLKRMGVGTQEAMDGATALRMVQSDPPDLILMDVSLPGMSGLDATRQLKSASTTKDIPVIALTAHAMPGDREQALAAGCDEYEVKPINFKRLKAKIEALLAT